MANDDNYGEENGEELGRLPPEDDHSRREEQQVKMP